MFMKWWFIPSPFVRLFNQMLVSLGMTTNLYTFRNESGISWWTTKISTIVSRFSIVSWISFRWWWCYPSVRAMECRQLNEKGLWVCRGSVRLAASISIVWDRHEGIDQLYASAWPIRLPVLLMQACGTWRYSKSGLAFLLAGGRRISVMLKVHQKNTDHPKEEYSE